MQSGIIIAMAQTNLVNGGKHQCQNKETSFTFNLPNISMKLLLKHLTDISHRHSAYIKKKTDKI